MRKADTRRQKGDPSYRRQKRAKGGDLAFVELNGRRHYLGSYDSEESREKYHRVLAEWRANKRQPRVEKNAITVAEVLTRFFTIAVEDYGEDSTEYKAFTIAARPLRKLYGRTPAVEFGPVALKAVREAFIVSTRRKKKKEEGRAEKEPVTNSRRYVSKQAMRVRRIFKVAASEGMIPARVYEDLRPVEGLKRGRGARETKPVEPVDLSLVEKTLPFLASPVAAAVSLQLATGARPDEVLSMRPCDLERVDDDGSERDVWIYTPVGHKTEHRGRSRRLYLGPKAQEIVTPFLLRPDEAYLFSPAEAEAERRTKAHEARKTPLSCGNSPGTNRKRSPQKRPGDRYKSDAYRRAILYACERAGVEPWTPYRLRHTRATQIRSQFGLEAAQVILGHAELAVTQVYAAKDEAAAIEIMRRIG